MDEDENKTTGREKMALLAHLFPHIRGSHEDIATLSLQYILMQSKELNYTFTKRLASIMHIELENTLQYACQIAGTGEEKERPDMVGIDSKGMESVLCEMKFYASLTDNQPLTYLDRLKNNCGKGLIFICPASRRTNLWSKLQELCNERKIKHIDSNCILVDGISLAISTWTEIIELLEPVASGTVVSADLRQLKDYCNFIDDEAFVPFDAEDLSAEMASRCDRYYQVVYEVIELLCVDNDIITSKDRLKSSPYRKGYSRSLYVNDYTITLNYDRELWRRPSTVETPFWVSITDKDWNQNEIIKAKFATISEKKKDIFWHRVFIALEPLQNATFEEVCLDLKKKILFYLSIIE